MILKQGLKLIMLISILAPLTFAQAPSQPQDPVARIQARVKALSDFVSLSDSQKQQITTIWTDADKNAAGARASMSSMRADLRKAVKSNDAAAIDKIAAEIGSIEGKNMAAGAKANAAIYALLTAEQKTKLDSATPQDTALRTLGTGLAPAAPPAPAPATAP